MAAETLKILGKKVKVHFARAVPRLGALEVTCGSWPKPPRWRPVDPHVDPTNDCRAVGEAATEGLWEKKAKVHFARAVPRLPARGSPRLVAGG